MPRRLSVVLLTSARTWRGSSVSLAGIAAALRERDYHVHMLAGDEAVVDGFAGLGLPASRVPIGDTGLREARALAQARSRAVELFSLPLMRSRYVAAIESGCA